MVSVPTTEEVRNQWAWNYPDYDNDRAEFDRWLAGVQAEAWEEGHWAFEQAWESDHLYPYDYVADNPYREETE